MTNAMLMSVLLLLSQQSPEQVCMMESEQCTISEEVIGSIRGNETDIQSVADDTSSLSSSVLPSYLYAATYNYNGYLQSSDGDDAIYYTGTTNNSYNLCVFFRIDIAAIRNECGLSGNDWSVIFDIPGVYYDGSLSCSYPAYDYGTSAHVTDAKAGNGILSIEYSSSMDYTLTDGKISFVLYNFSLSGCYETLETSQTSYRMCLRDESYDNASLISAFGASDHREMDLYVPEHSGSLPVIVTIHGGFWSEITLFPDTDSSAQEYYDRTYYDYLEDQESPYFNGLLSGEGFIHANIDYSLNDFPDGTAVTCGQMLTEINAALQRISSLCGTEADMSRLCLWGYSAGGHLAMMYSMMQTPYTYYISSEETRTFSQSYYPKFLISEAGPYYLTTGTTGISDETMRNLFDNLICGYSLQSMNHSDSYGITDSDLATISPHANVSRVPDYTIANYYSNDHVVPSTYLQSQMFTSSNFPSDNYMRINESYDYSGTDDSYVHQQYRDHARNYYSRYLSKLNLYL